MSSFCTSASVAKFLTYAIVCCGFVALIPLRGLLIASPRHSMLAYSALGLTAILHRTKIISSPPILNLWRTNFAFCIIKQLIANS